MCKAFCESTGITRFSNEANHGCKLRLCVISSNTESSMELMFYKFGALTRFVGNLGRHLKQIVPSIDNTALDSVVR